MTVKTKKKIMVVCSEESGDILAAKFMQSLVEECPEYDIEFVGVAGEKMEKTGLIKSIFPLSDISLMGLFEVLPHLKLVLKRIKQTVAVAKKEKVDLLLTVDGPEFSFQVAKKVKKALNVPCVHYGSPQVWAWRSNRVFKMEKFLDHVLALFPFEPKWYERTKLKCTYVGHPVVERFVDYAPKTAKKSLNKTLKVAILPGSRINELKYLLPEYAKAVIELKKKFKNIKFYVSVADGFDKEIFERYFSDVEYFKGEDKFKKIQSCDVAIACSGTANLELAMMGVPMVVCYKMNSLTYSIAKKLIKVKHISPVNIVAEKRIVKELIQENATCEEIVKATSPLLKDTKYRQQTLQELKTMRDKMHIQEAFVSDKVAKVIKNYL